MICDTLENRRVYQNINPLFARAFSFIAQNPRIVDGRHEIEGESLFCMVGCHTGKGKQQAALEAHRRYIDIQVCLEGVEVIGYKPLSGCRVSRETYDETKDIEFFADIPESWFSLIPGTWVALFPWDAHAPLAGEGMTRKIVFKVAL